MPSNQPETPTTDALDAAVARFNAWSFCRTLLMQGTAIQQDADVGKYPTYEHQSARVDEAARERAEVLDAVVAAVEARAVARERGRECAWTQRGTASWDTQCGEYIIATFWSKRCDECGGRVRVVGQR
jgi:hypothetical protein